MTKNTTSGIALLLLLLILFVLVGCKAAPADISEEKITVAVTILPQKTFVEAVCAGFTDVVVLVPPGNSPGNYEPTPQQMTSLNNAQVYFTIGVPTEQANILPDAKDLEIVDLSLCVSKIYPDRTMDEGGRDPHIWLSPKRAIVMVETIADKMCVIDPDNASIYLANAADYIEKLTLLDDEIKEKLGAVQNNTFLTFHPSLGYFAEDYGLNMVSLEQHGKEATAQHLTDMIDLAAEQNIRVVFSQAEIDSKQADAFAQQIGGKKVMLSPLSSDYIANLRSIADAIAASLS